jgi:hypothetical protein
MRLGYARQEALEMTDEERMAEIIGAGETRGGEWDWEEMEWSKVPEAPLS